ncbi:MAG: acetyl esterase/lipase [Cyclobacteriaceae bacterium]|jgi:acetyl esterase/lipase
MKTFLILIFTSFMIIEIQAQNTIIPLWENGIPNSKKTDEKEVSEEKDIVRISKVQEPTIEVYLPAKKNATGQAVVICPGGGYGILAYDWEGTDVAKWLNSIGVAGIVVKYRLPNSKSVVNRHQVPLMDAQRALRLVRYNSEKWNIDKEKIGVMGFSAGGHLASTLGTHFDDKLANTEDLINMISARPDFMILIYPVITMGEPNVHGGSRRNLLGPDPSNELIKEFSNEQQVKTTSPPTFLVHSADDKSVPVANSIMMYEALLSKDIPVEMHLFPKGGHGYSMAPHDESLNAWTGLLTTWLSKL